MRSFTCRIDVVGEEEVELPDADVDVVGVDAETRVQTIGRFFQALTVCALQWHRFEQDHLDKVQSPDLK